MIETEWNEYATIFTIRITTNIATALVGGK